MWQRERLSTGEVLRVGRRGVERWKSVDGALSVAAVHALPQETSPQPSALVEAVTALYATPTVTPVTVVLESAWLPIMLADVGSELLRKSQLDALLRHRFALCYADHLDPVNTWELRAEHRPGTRHALAYGLAPRIRQALMAAAQRTGLKWAALTPAIAWGLDKLNPETTWPRKNGWFLWPEQDRTLVAWMAAREIIGLNPGATDCNDEAGLVRLTEVESIRLGIDQLAAPIAAASWGAPSRGKRLDGRLQWLDIGRGGRAPSGVPPVSAANATVRAAS